MTTIRGYQAARNTMLAAAVAMALLASGQSVAQVATATIRGQISQDAAPAHGGGTLMAVNMADGRTYRGSIAPDGSYVLVGLAPGRYQITVNAAGSAKTSEPVTLTVGETASIDFALPSVQAAATLEPVLVTGTRYLAAVKNSEVGTAVSAKQIDTLPQITRNVLSFADLAPGVRFDVDQGSGQVRLQSGAQNQDNVGLFIDGVNQKNYVLRGGVAGMDSTRGNPFPQSAISEYRVINQNYKAEYDQVSSVAISAITRSGTNDLHLEGFIDRTGDSMTAMSPFEKAAEAQGVARPSYHQEQYGINIGGPIVHDKVHFFLAYEGKNIAQPRQVILQNDNLLPNAGIVPSLRAQQGGQNATFKENLVLGKLSAELSDEQRIEAVLRVRREADFVPENMQLSLLDNSQERSNDETRFDLKHEFSSGSWLNQVNLDWQKTVWNPHAKVRNAKT